MTLWAVLLASLVGSLHCAAMCGGFAAAVPVAGAHGGPGAQRWATFAYHLGRGLGYVALGALAGLLGAGAQGLGQMVGLQRVASVVTGGLLVVLAGATLWNGSGKQPGLVQLRRTPSPSRVAGLFARILRRGGIAAAGGLGIATVALPCAWLWSYVLVAAGSGSLPGGVAVMIAFWLGTLPALLSVGGVARWLKHRFGRIAPRASAAVLLLLGGLALAGKLPAPAGTSTPPCHEASP